MKPTRVSDLEQYTACVVFYTTDFAYNRIKDCEQFIPNRDKETKRIWGALYKRYRNYFHQTCSMEVCGINFIAFFSEHMDDKIDSCIDGLRDFMTKELEGRNIADASFFAHVEIARICTDFAIYITNSMIGILKECKIETNMDPIFDMRATMKALDDFNSWITRKISSQQIAICDTDRLVATLDTYKKSIMEYESFLESYKYAIEEEKKYGT